MEQIEQVRIEQEMITTMIDTIVKTKNKCILLISEQYHEPETIQWIYDWPKTIFGLVDLYQKCARCGQIFHTIKTENEIDRTIIQNHKCAEYCAKRASETCPFCGKFASHPRKPAGIVMMVISKCEEKRKDSYLLDFFGENRR